MIGLTSGTALAMISGVLNLWDVGLMVGAILVMPYLYLALPLWLAAGLLALASGHRLGIGLGDLLLATVFPLVMRKAFGRAAARRWPSCWAHSAPCWRCWNCAACR